MSFEPSLSVEPRLLPQGVEMALGRWGRRGAGLGLLAVALLGWTSLASWSASDPSLSHTVAGTASNWLGGIGAIVSDLLLQAFGLASVACLIAPLWWGTQVLATDRLPGWQRRMGLAVPLVLCLAAALGSLPAPNGWPIQNGLGGALGRMSHEALAALFALAHPGTAAIVAGLVCLVAGLLLFPMVLGCDRATLLAAATPPATLFGLGDGSLPAAGHGRTTTHGGAAGWLQRTIGDGAVGQWARRSFGSRAGAAPADPALAPVEMTGGDAPHDPFEVATDELSRRIAERFAPAGAASTGDGSASLPAGVHASRGVGRVRGNLLGGMTFGAAKAKGSANSGAKPSARAWQAPSLNMLAKPNSARPGPEFTQTVLRGSARLLEDVLADFGVKGEVKDIKPGPVVTLFELEPARGTKSSRVIGLADDIARSMSAASARVAVVPGRNVLGIELPNVRRETVMLREILDADAFRTTGAQLPIALGKSIGGEAVVADLARMPHLLVAGTTGSGKSVGVNAMILSLIYRLAPEQCRLLLIDPKMLELSVYNGIPHLLTPVVTDPAKAVAALNWAVGEMEERYKRMSELGVRNIDVYNNRVRNAQKRGEALARTVQTGFDPVSGQPVYEKQQLDQDTLPYIVIVVDEFADLMMVAGKDIEAAVQRLAQMARAAGIHLIMATQRPSVDVITGTIKANFPTRISFKVASKIDSRTILNEQGAEQLLGQGDMLLSNGGGGLTRIHGAFVSDEEVEAVAGWLREQQAAAYIEIDVPVAPGRDPGDGPERSGSDDLYDKAVALVLRDRKASTSYIQRRLSIGYNRAADLMERMEAEGLVSPANHAGKRDILIAVGGACPDPGAEAA